MEENNPSPTSPPASEDEHTKSKRKYRKPEEMRHRHPPKLLPETVLGKRKQPVDTEDPEYVHVPTEPPERKVHITLEEKAAQATVTAFAEALVGNNLHNIAALWLRYTPTQQGDYVTNMEYLVEHVLFTPFELELTRDTMQLFRDAPTLNVPAISTIIDNDTARHVACMLEQKERYFTLIRKEELSGKVTLRNFKYNLLLDRKVNRPLLLLDIMMKLLDKSISPDIGFCNFIIQTRLALDKLFNSKIKEQKNAENINEVPGTEELRKRHLCVLLHMEKVLRREDLYDVMIKRKQIHDEASARVQNSAMQIRDTQSPSLFNSPTISNSPTSISNTLAAMIHRPTNGLAPTLPSYALPNLSNSPRMSGGERVVERAKLLDIRKLNELLKMKTSSMTAAEFFCSKQ